MIVFSIFMLNVVRINVLLNGLCYIDMMYVVLNMMMILFIMIGSRLMIYVDKCVFVDSVNSLCWVCCWLCMNVVVCFIIMLVCLL